MEGDRTSVTPADERAEAISEYPSAETVIRQSGSGASVAGQTRSAQIVVLGGDFLVGGYAAGAPPVPGRGA